MQNLQDDNSQIDIQLFKTEKQLENYKTIQNLYQQCGDHCEHVNKPHEVELNEVRDKNRALETRLSEMEKQVKRLLNVNREASAVMRSQELQLRFLRRQLEERDQENREAKEGVSVRSARRFEKMRRDNVKIRAEVDTLRKKWREVESRGKFGGETEYDLDSILETIGDWKDSTLLGCGDYCDSEKKDIQTDALPNKGLFLSGRSDDVIESKDKENEVPGRASFLSGDNSIRDRKSALSEQQQSVCKRNNTQCEISSRESFLSGPYSVREMKGTLSEQHSRTSILSGDYSFRERKDASFLSAARRVTASTGSDVTRPLLWSRDTHNRGPWGGETAILDILKEKSGCYGECGKDLVIDILKDLVTRECLERTAILDQRAATGVSLSSRFCSSCSELLSDREKPPTPRQTEKDKKSRCDGDVSSQPKKSGGSKVERKMSRPKNGDKRKTRRTGKRSKNVRRSEQNERKPRQTMFGNGNSRLRNVVDGKKTKSPYETWKKGPLKEKKKKSSKFSKKSCQKPALVENVGCKNVSRKKTKCKENYDVSVRNKLKLRTVRKSTNISKTTNTGKSPITTRRGQKNGMPPTRSENKKDSTERRTRSDKNRSTPSRDTRLKAEEASTAREGTRSANMNGNLLATCTRSENMEPPTTETIPKEIVSHQRIPDPFHASTIGSKSSSSTSSKKKQHFFPHHINFRFSKQSTSVPSHILKPKSSLQSTYKSLQSTCKSAPSYVISPARLKVGTEEKARQVPSKTARPADPHKRSSTAAHRKTKM